MHFALDFLYFSARTRRRNFLFVEFFKMKTCRTLLDFVHIGARVGMSSFSLGLTTFAPTNRSAKCASGFAKISHSTFTNKLDRLCDPQQYITNMEDTKHI